MLPNGYDARPTTDWYGQNVVVAAAHAVVLREIVKQVPRSGNFRLFDATLVAEVNNQSSSSNYAISVRWQNQVIGYLPDAETEPYIPELVRLAASGVAAVVKAQLWTNLDEPGRAPGEERFTVTVGVQPAGEIVPINDPPFAQWVLIPRGTAITVITDRQIFKVAKNCDSGHYLVTLHPIAGGVEVRLDDKYIGTLPAATSENIRPLVEAYDKQGLIAACHATIDMPDVLVDINSAYQGTAEPVISPLPTLVPYRKNPRDYQIPVRQQEQHHPSPTAAASAASAAQTPSQSTPSSQTASATPTPPEPPAPQTQPAPPASSTSAQDQNAPSATHHAHSSAAYQNTPPPQVFPAGQGGGRATAAPRTNSRLIPLIAVIGVAVFLSGLVLLSSCLSHIADSASSGTSSQSSSTSQTSSDQYDSGGSRSSASDDADYTSSVADSDLAETAKSITGTAEPDETIKNWGIFQAREACHRYLAKQLKSPQSARFEPESGFAAEQSSDASRWALVGYVDLPQRSGTILRVSWVCEVIPVDADNAQVRATFIK